MYLYSRSVYIAQCSLSSGAVQKPFVKMHEIWIEYCLKVMKKIEKIIISFYLSHF